METEDDIAGAFGEGFEVDSGDGQEEATVAGVVPEGGIFRFFECVAVVVCRKYPVWDHKDGKGKRRWTVSELAGETYEAWALRTGRAAKRVVVV